MLKKIVKVIGRKLMKINWIRHEVEVYQLIQKQKRHHERWAELMCSGYKVRNLNPEKKDPHETLAIVTDDGLIVEWMDGRMVGQRVVNPVFMDSTQWGGMK